MTTLWDLIAPVVAPAPRRLILKPAAKTPRRGGPARARYDQMTRTMLAAHEVRVRKWRSSMSGVAWQITYRDGSVSRLIEAPRPRGPVSAAVFLHEVGHHAIGFGRYKPRCLEEYHAWMFALAQMEAFGLTRTEAVHRRVHESLHYAVEKATRRGLKSIPAQLAPYVTAPRRNPPRPRRRG